MLALQQIELQLFQIFRCSPSVLSPEPARGIIQLGESEHMSQQFKWTIEQSSIWINIRCILSIFLSCGFESGSPGPKVVMIPLCYPPLTTVVIYYYICNCKQTRGFLGTRTGKIWTQVIRVQIACSTLEPSYRCLDLNLFNTAFKLVTQINLLF